MHYLAGIIISLFVVLHLFNHVCSLAGAAQHIATMEKLRPIYRNTYSETLLVLAVLVQITSGLMLYINKRNSALTRVDKWQQRTGLYLSVFFVIHVGAVLVGRHVLHLDTNLYFGVAGINTFPFNLFFIPYYALGILSFFGHLACLHYKKMTHTLLGFTPVGQSKAIIFFGIVITVILFYGLTNRFEGFQIPTEYGILIGK